MKQFRALTTEYTKELISGESNIDYQDFQARVDSANSYFSDKCYKFLPLCMTIRKFKEFSVQDCISSTILFADALQNIEEINISKTHKFEPKQKTNYIIAPSSFRSS